MVEKVSRADFTRWAAKLLEAEHWLRSKPGRNDINPVGKKIVLVPKGYQAQQQELKVAHVALKWLAPEHVDQTADETSAAVAPLLGVEERCVVQDATYHKQPKRMTHGTATGLFVRLKLIKADDSSKAVLIDYHLGTGSGEFVVPTSKYEAAKMRQWQVGDRLSMWWVDQEDPTTGTWYHGVVRQVKPLRHRQRKRGSALGGSMCPWNTLEVEWDDVDEDEGRVTWVNFWEISEDMRGEDMEEHGPIARGTAPTHNNCGAASDATSQSGHRASSNQGDEDARVGREGPAKRPRKRRQMEGYLTEDMLDALDVAVVASDSDEEFQRVVKKKASGTSRKSPGTARKRDWNSGFCHVCLDGGTLIECDGVCLRSFHSSCLHQQQRPKTSDPEDKWLCSDCRKMQAMCIVCRKYGEVDVNIHKCRMGSCGLHYHPDCVRKLEPTMPMRVTWSKAAKSRPPNVQRPSTFTCPRHYCSVCQGSGDACKMYHCFTCCTSYHAKCRPMNLETHQGKYVSCPACQKKGLGPQNRVPGTRALALAFPDKARAPSCSGEQVPSRSSQLQLKGEDQGADAEEYDTASREHGGPDVTVPQDFIPQVSRSGRIIKQPVRDDPFDNLKYTGTGQLRRKWGVRSERGQPPSSPTTSSLGKVHKGGQRVQQTSSLMGLGPKGTLKDPGSSLASAGQQRSAAKPDNAVEQRASDALADSKNNGKPGKGQLAARHTDGTHAGTADNRQGTDGQKDIVLASLVQQQQLESTSRRSQPSGHPRSPQLSTALSNAPSMQLPRPQPSIGIQPTTGLPFHRRSNPAAMLPAPGNAAGSSRTVQHAKGAVPAALGKEDGIVVSGVQEEADGAITYRTSSHSSTVASAGMLNAAAKTPYVHIIKGDLHKHLVGKDTFVIGCYNKWGVDLPLPPGTPEKHSVITVAPDGSISWAYASQKAADMCPASLERNGRWEELPTTNVAAQPPVSLQPQDKLCIAYAMFHLYMA